MMTPKFKKIIASLIGVAAISIATAYPQAARTVMVNSNSGILLFPTNLWSANASNARSGLNLGTAATNPASAFQSSSSVLSNLASSNAINLTNVRATNIIGTVSISNGGTGTSTAAGARTTLGLGPTNNVSFNSVTIQSNLVSSNGSYTAYYKPTGIEIYSGTNQIFKYEASDAEVVGDLNFTDDISFTQPVSVGTDIDITTYGIIGYDAEIDLDEKQIFAGAGYNWSFLGSGLEGVGDISFSTSQNASVTRANLGFSTNLNTFWTATNAAVARTNLGLGATWLTNTDVTNFRTAIGLGSTNAVTFGNVAATSIKYEFGGSTAIDLGDGILRNQSQSVLEFGDSNVIYVSLPIAFVANSLAGATRTNLGIGATWLTNTNVTNFRSAIGLGWSALTNSNAGTSLVSVNTNGTVVSPTNFWQVAPIQTLVQSSAPNTNSTNAATNARNLYYYSLATNIINVTNTITLPTNTSAFDGDEVTVIHRGGSNSVTTVRELGSTNNLISLNSYDEAVKFIKDGNWDFYHNISFTEAIKFSGTNAAANITASRENLGLGATNIVEFNSLFLTNGSLVIGTDGTNSVGIGITSSGIEFEGNRTNGLISFIGTNLASTFRSDIGLGATWLTNTNLTNFRDAINLGYSNNQFAQIKIFKNTNGIFTPPLDPNFGIFFLDVFSSVPQLRFVYSGSHYSVAFTNSLPSWALTTDNSVARTNLGLGLPALTNTNNATFQQDIFTTNAAPTNAGTFNDHAAWMGVSIVTNGVTNVFRIPLYK